MDCVTVRVNDLLTEGFFVCDTVTLVVRVEVRGGALTDHVADGVSFERLYVFDNLRFRVSDIVCEDSLDIVFDAVIVTVG